MRIREKIGRTTYGRFSLALFVICIVSGIFIAIPYNVNKPYESISLLMIANPAASLFRNLHYWSAQLFLIFSMLHIYDHFSKKEGIRLKKGLWARLSVGVLIILLAMLTGFLLKADADALQARRILNSLITGIPLVGNLLDYSLLGKEGNFQLIYVNHIATFTIFITVIVFEHTRKFWPGWGDFVAATLITTLLSFFITAPLHNNLNPTVKGPWYFLGLQEILHWLSHPELSMLIVSVFILLIFLVPFGGKRNGFITKRSLLILTIAYFMLTATGLFFRGENWKWMWPWERGYVAEVLPQISLARLHFRTEINPQQAAMSPVINGHKESCVLCHDDVAGFTASHDPKAIGCFSCHGGHPFESDNKEAHEGMLLIPGNLTDANRSCGTANCHPEITGRINSTLMATLSGMISVDRFVFNEQDSPDSLTSVHYLGHSAADEHLKNLCVRCHLGNPKTETGAITEKSRGGGCLACHLNYSDVAVASWFEHQSNRFDTSYLEHHPAISLKVSNDHCFGCHSRSGRISTSYEGWHETLISPDDMPENKNYRLVEDTRVFTYIKEDVHYQLGMTCIDCHNSYELMGDGNLYAHEEQQVNIQCEDCHFNGKPQVTDQKSLDQESAIIASLRFGNVSARKFLSTQKKKRPLINTYYRNDTAFLIGKDLKKVYAMKSPAAICTRGKTHDALSCSSCHASWAPSCIGCHNQYDPGESGYNMLANKQQMGGWVEYVGEYSAHLPALGIRKDEGKKSVVPVVPGMILSIDLSGFDKNLHDSLIFKRLFAPIEPHTTQTQGRSCKSCHNNPVALGYGQGSLQYVVHNKTGHWIFKPKYENSPYDSLPEDAWIGFLQERNGAVSTRVNVAPFSITDQKRILTVGACLTCHKDNSKIMQESLVDFNKVLAEKSEQCILPAWK